MARITILGAGAWGTTLAKILSHSLKHRVILWTKNKDIISSFCNNRENKTYLPGIILNSNVTVTADVLKTLNTDVILVVVPAQAVRSLLVEISPYLNSEIPLVICSKGLEIDTGKLMSEVGAEIVENDILILSGPNLAKELAKELPSAASLGIGKNKANALFIAELFNTRYFNLVLETDVIAVQVGGALKNVIAIACGLIEGQQWGENAKAILINIGFREIQKFCLAKGGNLYTLLSLCGIGDLFLTCNSNTSRNTQWGYKISTKQITIKNASLGPAVVEGIYTAKAVYQFSLQNKLHLPLTELIYKVIYEELSLEETLEQIYKIITHPFI